MRILIVGSGVIGVTSAWYLREAGHEVVVVERQPGPALETSFANAGEISPGYASPWAAPGIPLKALKWLLARHAPLSIRPTLDLAQYRWLWQMLCNCTRQRYAISKARMVRLAEYSRDCLRQLRQQTGIGYEERTLGTLQLFRTQAQLDSTQRDIAVLREYGMRFQLLDRAGVVACEPGLAHSQAPIAGGLHLPGDETGDCHLFTRQLAERAAAQGVEFRFNQSVDMLCSDGGRITGVAIAGRLERADAYVLAPGSWTASLLAPLGLYLPVYPLKGYSLTLPMIDAQRAPRSTVVDETYKVAITRFEQRIRVGGMAEVCGYDRSLSPRRRDTLLMVLESLYPGSADVSAAEFWTGLRPATPDGPPVVGATPLSNLFLNTGHGTLGWTMACGSARYLSDVIGERTSEIDPEGLGFARYHAPWPSVPVTR